MTHKIPVANWPTALAKTVEAATDGDTVEVHTVAMRQLAEQLQGLACPDKALRFEVVPPEGAGELLAMLEDTERIRQRAGIEERNAALIEKLKSDDQPIVKNAVRCRICGAAADRYITRFQCQANAAHVGDLNVGIFSDLTFPEST